MATQVQCANMVLLGCAFAFLDPTLPYPTHAAATAAVTAAHPSSSSSSSLMQLHLLDPTSPAARGHDPACLDGSAAGFYVLRSNTSTKWLISQVQSHIPKSHTSPFFKMAPTSRHLDSR